LHISLRQLGQPDAEIDVGAGIVGVPAALLAAVAAEHHAAEVEASGKGRASWKPRRSVVAVAAGPDSLSVGHADANARDADDGDRCPHQVPDARVHGDRIRPIAQRCSSRSTRCWAVALPDAAWTTETNC